MKFEAAEFIRKNLNEQRKSLAAHDVSRLSSDIIGRFLHIFKLSELDRKTPLRVGLYRAISSELELTQLEIAFLKEGFLLHYPRVVNSGEQKKLEFVEVSTSKANPLHWKISSFGIQEPISDLEAVPPESLDLIFLPGVAFGESGERIGMGAGYYDRFLAQSPGALRVALTFDFQVLAQLEQNPWDQSVHWIITEKRSFQMPYVQEWFQNRLEEQDT